MLPLRIAGLTEVWGDVARKYNLSDGSYITKKWIARLLRRSQHERTQGLGELRFVTGMPGAGKSTFAAKTQGTNVCYDPDVLKGRLLLALTRVEEGALRSYRAWCKEKNEPWGEALIRECEIRSNISSIYEELIDVKAAQIFTEVCCRLGISVNIVAESRLEYLFQKPWTDHNPSPAKLTHVLFCKPATALSRRQAQTGHITFNTSGILLRAGHVPETSNVIEYRIRKSFNSHLLNFGAHAYFSQEVMLWDADEYGAFYPMAILKIFKCHNAENKPKWLVTIYDKTRLESYGLDEKSLAMNLSIYDSSEFYDMLTGEYKVNFSKEGAYNQQEVIKALERAGVSSERIDHLLAVDDIVITDSPLPGQNRPSPVYLDL